MNETNAITITEVGDVVADRAPEVLELQTPETASDPVASYLLRLAPSSRLTMKRAWEKGVCPLLEFLPSPLRPTSWGGFTYATTGALRALIVEGRAPRTANLWLSCLRGVLKEAWRLDLISAEQYHRAADIQDVRVETLPKGRHLEAGELRALFEAIAADSGSAARRDAALLAVLVGGGLRRSEAVGLELGDYDRETGALKVRKGKGGKQRLVYATNGARDAIDDWLAVRGQEAGPLFCPCHKGGNVEIRRMVPATIVRALERRAQQAGLSRPFSPHDLRRTFIGSLLDAGADISAVQQLAGHSQVSTTQGYDRRGERAKLQAAELVHVPYVAPAVRT